MQKENNKFLSEKEEDRISILIYRTNISSKKQEKQLQPFFDAHPHVLDWNVDREDVDNVLRIEISDGITGKEVLTYIRKKGLLCEELYSSMII